MNQVHAKKDDSNFTRESGQGTSFEGDIHISEDVLVELARKTILGISNIQLANMGIASKFGIGRKSGDGIRVSVDEGAVPSISVDAYVLVKYGQRIPDLAWDVQEKIKHNLERYTGYTVSIVNINVQGIYLDEPVVMPDENKEELDQTKEDLQEEASLVENESDTLDQK